MDAAFRVAAACMVGFVTATKAITLVDHDLQALSAEFQEVFEAIIEQGKLTDEQNAVLADHIKSGQIAKREKIAELCIACRDESKRLKAHEEAIAQRRRQIERIAEFMESFVFTAMDELGITRIDTITHRFAIKKNPPSVEITDLEALPGEFVNLVPTPDKMAIKAAWQEGREVPGSKLITDKKHLEIS